MCASAVCVCVCVSSPYSPISNVDVQLSNAFGITVLKNRCHPQVLVMAGPKRPLL